MKTIRRASCAILAAFLPALAFGQTIPDQIDANLAAVSGNSWTALVENRNGSVIYYQKNPTTGLAPASNTKIFTSSAAFGLLGTNHSFESRVYYAGTLSGGTLTGNLNLVSEHDITWNSTVFSNPRAPLDFIASHVKVLGVTNITGNVQCYGCCFYNLDSEDAGNHDSSTQTADNATAAAAFVAALQAQGITVSGTSAGQTGFSPPGTLLYTYQSINMTYQSKQLRLDVACIPMMKVSHNVMADALCRHIGYKLTGTDSFAAGAAQVLRWMSTNGIATNGIVMNDGSGLNSGNRFSARQTVSMVRFMMDHYTSWATCLPISCTDGTISGRMCSTDSTGYIHAKTGSLSVSIALSGYVTNQYDGQVYLFSFIGNKSGIDQTATRNAVDNSAVLFSARGVPISPELIQVSGTGSSIQISWSDEKFVRTSYRVYTSTDGTNFGAPVALGLGAQSYAVSGLSPGTKRYFKVSVFGAGGESKPSRTYGAMAGGNPRVLIVDGDDRYQFQIPENPQCTNHAFCALAGENISGIAFDTANHNAVIDGTVHLTNYPAVIWMLGEEGVADESFSAAEQSLVTAYLNSGGNLFVSGSECAYDLDRGSGPTTADRNFFHNQLRAVFSADDANTYAFAPLPAGIFSGNASSGFDNGTKGTYNVDFPDVITPTNGSIACLSYTGGTGGAAGVQYDGSLGGGKLMYWGFPFETITNPSVRTAYMSDVMRFFGLVPRPVLGNSSLGAGNSITLNWSSVAGLNYRVQYKNNLMDSNWQNLAGDVTATNTTSFKTDAPPGTQRFYRVQLLN